MNLTRRDFLAASLAAGVAITSRSAAWAAEGQRPPVCVFSKHLQFITDYGDLARTAKDLGLDGLDLTVRTGGHVLPENAATDLPRAVEAIRAEGLDVPMITTGLDDGTDADARPILEAASKLRDSLRARRRIALFRQRRYHERAGWIHAPDAIPRGAYSANTTWSRGTTTTRAAPTSAPSCGTCTT